MPTGQIDPDIMDAIRITYIKSGELIEHLEFREAIRAIMELVETANKYYDTQEPWKQVKKDINGFNNTIYTCAVVIANLSNLFSPIMPKASQKLRDYLEISENSWSIIKNLKEVELNDIQPLFTRI